MISPIEFYQVTCDNCNRDYENDQYGCQCFHDPDEAISTIQDDGWKVGDGEEGEQDKIYCPSCWTYNDNDEFTVIPKANPATPNV